MDKTKSQILDELLVLQARRGDKEAFEQLVIRWHKKLICQSQIRTNNWEESQDLVQDVWQWLIGNLHKLEGISNFGSWIRTIVDRRSIDWIRKQSRLRNTNQQRNGSNRNNDNDPLGHTDSTEDIKEESLSNLEKALYELTPEMKMILKLYYSESNSILAISKIMKIPKGTVKSRLFHAREKLKKTLNEKQDEKSK